jgi:rhomboid protease GluP
MGPGNSSYFTVTNLLIAVNLLAYLISMVISGSFADIPPQDLVSLGAIYGPLVVPGGEWWRLATAMFLHGGVTHILMNLYSLYIVGRLMELYFDAKSYLGIYAVSGLAGGLASLYIHPESVAIGASGAIFGIFGALGGYFFFFRHKLNIYAQPLIKDFGVIIAINLILGFAIPNIDMSAHIGGFVVGTIGGFWVARYPKHLYIFIVSMALLMIGTAFYLQSLYLSPLF